MDSYDVIAGAVIDYWKVNYPQDVVAFFQQKYSWDDNWELCEELVECNGYDDYENMTFLSDFCEGQTEVKDVAIIPLREVTAFYYKRKIKIHENKPMTNADRIRAMSDEELASFLGIEYWRLPKCNSVDLNGECVQPDCTGCWLDWLKEEVEG